MTEKIHGDLRALRHARRAVRRRIDVLRIVW
jgi:hypothetical protein